MVLMNVYNYAVNWLVAVVTCIAWSIVVVVTCALLTSGVAGPLAAEGGGQICRPFVLGF